jgi:pilus assembly protein CpaF
VFGKRTSPGSDARGEVLAEPAPQRAAPAPAESLPAPAAGPDLGRALPAAGLGAPIVAPPTAPIERRPPPLAAAAAVVDSPRSQGYYEVKAAIFNALIEAIDLAQLARLDAESAREEIRDIVNEIIAIKSIVMSISEQEELLDDICNDVLGYGPLEPLLARDDIADIMVNGAETVYIEVAGKSQRTGIRFRDNHQLFNICQRIVSQVGRRVDDSSPI